MKYSDWNNIPIEICIKMYPLKNDQKSFLENRKRVWEIDGNEMDNNMTIFDISFIRIVFAGDRNTIVLYICLWW